MESLRVLKETLDYVRQFRGKTIILKISKIVLANSMKLTNVIKDIILLRNSEINVVVTHSESQFKRDPWLGLEPVIFLDIATISGVENQIALGILPVVFFDETLPLSSEKAITSLAIKLGAAKIIYITNYDGIFQSGSLISEMNVERAIEFIGRCYAGNEKASRSCSYCLQARNSTCAHHWFQGRKLNKRNFNLSWIRNNDLRKLLPWD